MAETTTEKKIQTRFPGLQARAGVRPEEMEVLEPVGEGGAAAQEAQGQENSGGEQQNQNPDASQQQQQAGAKKDTKQDVQPDKKKELDLDNLSDEDRNALLKKLTKGKVNSLDDLEEPPAQKTKEQLEQEAATRRNDALAWAIDSGKVKREEYESAIVLNSKSDDELALQAFTESVIAEDPNVTPEEAAELFKDAYHQGQKEDSPLYKAGQREIKKLADAIRKEKTGMLSQIEPEYDNFTQTQSQYKNYRKQVKSLAEALPKTFDFNVPYKSADGKEETLTYSMPVDSKLLDKIVSEISAEQSFVVKNVSSNGKIDEKSLSAEMQHHLKARMFDELIPTLLSDHGKKVEEKLMVVLGNKRSQNQHLANGQQQTKPGEQKQNSYPGLNEFNRKQRV